MKTRILFVIQQLKRSEEAVALLERLYRLSPKRYAIDLYVPSRGGELMRKVPPYVSITAKPPAGEYDMAAAFAGSQKAAEYVAEYAHAAKTYLFLFTVLPDPSWKRQPDFTRFDQIYTASNAVKAALLRLCPALGAKTSSLPDTIQRQRLERLSARPGGYEDTDFEGIRLLSVGHLDGHRFDLALAAARHLKRRGFYFHWYIMGGGSEWLRMRFLIHVMELADCVFLMREPVNPYPYYVQSDLFVSTRMAGERDAAIEAALMLEMDVVAVDDPRHRRLLEWEEGVLLVEDDPAIFADAIEYMVSGIEDE